MGIRTYLGGVVTDFRTNGVRSGTRTAGRDLLFGVYHSLPIRIGTSVFEREWDILIILDACRPDLLEEVSGQYDFLPSEMPTMYSVGSRSDTWMQKNFAEKYRDELARTAYVTGNPYSDSFCSEREFALLDEVWSYAWDEDVGSVPAEDITDRAIATGRNHDFGRLLIHYMQPHFPSFPQPLAEGIDLERFGTEWSSVWDQLEDGTLSRQEVWSSYKKNLEYVLDNVGILLRNLDGDIVILSADHGNAIGEWGMYGHPINKPAPVLRRVPWVQVSSTDTQEYTTNVENMNGSLNTRIEARLNDLGYKK